MPQLLRILIVDDNSDDVAFSVAAVTKAGLAGPIEVASDGAEALARLNAPARVNSRRPDLVLLDLHMPKVSGFEVLAAMKKSPALSAIPVIVFTNSDLDLDTLNSYGLNPAACLQKPLRPQDLKAIARKISASLGHE